MAGNAVTVLVLEDEPLVRELLSDTLRTDGYTVAAAGTAAEAVEAAEELERLDVLVTDVLLPRSSGFEVALRLRALRPSVGLVFVTGWMPDDVSVPPEIAEPYAVLRKPLGGRQLLDAVAAASAAAVR
jgi:CheY-like chemotaxis protein